MMDNTDRFIESLTDAYIEDLSPGVWHSFVMGYGSKIGGDDLYFPLKILKAEKPGPRFTIIGGVHGDEFEGPRALWDFSQQDLLLTQGTVVVVPIANLPAFEAGTRTSPLDGLNLARSFPGQEDGLPTQRLAYKLFHEIVEGSDLLADLHSGGIRYLHTPLMGFYDLPNSIGQQSFAAAQSTNWSTLWAAPLRAGVLSYEAVQHGIPAIGTEVGGSGLCLKSDYGIYSKTLRNLLLHLGMIAGEQQHHNDAIIIDGDWYLCPTSGFLESEVALNQTIDPGMLLGRVYSPTGQVKAEIRSKHHGIIVGIRTFPPIYTGEWSFFVGLPR